ncbi:MAG: hypothetical protein LWY06_20325 [Firmicutes bacterium]|nr:hypothetical protein [Bacillota bacterium]
MKLVFVCEKYKSKLVKACGIMEQVVSVSGFQTARCEIDEAGQDAKENIKALSGADLLVIGTEPTGWDGVISDNLKKFIASCSHIEGRKVVVFSLKKLFGDKKALKNLMKAVEERGGFLFDFDIIAGEQDAKAFAERLKSAKK